MSDDDEFIGQLLKELDATETSVKAAIGHVMEEPTRPTREGAAAIVIRTLRARIAELENKVYVPGLWRCAKCSFELQQSNLNAQNGTVTPRDQPGDKCPNCDAPLWRVTERERHHAAMKAAERFWQESYDTKSRIAELEAMVAGKSETHVWVPKEPTAAMCIAAEHTYNEVEASCDWSDEVARPIYEAMLAASEPAGGGNAR